jgi:hypothetical protein
MEIQTFPDHGRTAFASKRFEPGETVLEEEPLLVWQSEIDEDDGDELYGQLATIVSGVNAAFEEDPNVHAVHTDSVFILCAYLAADPRVRAAFVILCIDEYARRIPILRLLECATWPSLTCQILK